MRKKIQWTNFLKIERIKHGSGYDSKNFQKNNSALDADFPHRCVGKSHKMEAVGGKNFLLQACAAFSVKTPSALRIFCPPENRINREKRQETPACKGERIFVYGYEI